MSKDVSEPAPAQLIQPAPITLNAVIPKPVQLVCAVLIVLGVIIAVLRPGINEASVYSGMQGADTKLFSQKDNDGKPVVINDGLNEMFGLVQFHNNDADVSRYYTYCGSNPAMALRVFRKAMTEGNVSSKIIAAHGSLFLAESGALEASDYDLLRSALDPAQPIEVRRVAQRAISDLTALKNVGAAATYEEIPADLPPPEKGDPARKIATHKEALFGTPVLYVRWSSPDLAAAWLKVNATKGAWDAKQQRFAIP